MPIPTEPIGSIPRPPELVAGMREFAAGRISLERSEEHTSELQSRSDLVCRLLLEKKNKRSLRQIRAQTHSGLCRLCQSDVSLLSALSVLRVREFEHPEHLRTGYKVMSMLLHLRA